MMQPAIVSTECPSCGAPVDFSEGTNAVQCQHCQTRLLVTGRTQLLSYQLAPTVDARDAARAAVYECETAGRPGRVRDATLWLVPYYRMTGHDLRWEWEIRERQPREAVDDSEVRLLAAVLPHGMPIEPPSSDEGGRQLQLRDRYIEKSFLACAVEGLPLPVSLGLRPSVLRLHLFHPEITGAHVRVIPPTVTPERAWEMGLKAVGANEAVYRRVLRQVLSLVYQPVWAVAMAIKAPSVSSPLRGGDAATDAIVFVDALTGKPLRRDDHRLNADVPADAHAPAARVAGLRPLICPNCGWAFPLKPEEVIAACGSCWHAYAIDADDLRPVEYRLGVPPQGNGEHASYMPFWILDAGVESERLTMHVPAFRYRRLKFLVDLTRALSDRAPEYRSVPASPFSGCGAFYDEEDAAALAAFVLAAAKPDSDRKAKQLMRSPLEVHSANLVWLPYRQERDEVVDPFTGRAFSIGLLG